MCSLKWILMWGRCIVHGVYFPHFDINLKSGPKWKGKGSEKLRLCLSEPSSAPLVKLSWAAHARLAKTGRFLVGAWRISLVLTFITWMRGTRWGGWNKEILK